jgi:aminomethyltransferase
MKDTLKRTPLHAFHLDHGARMVPFAGWEMPVQYTSILEEHLAVRTKAGLFDVSHMGQLRVHGSEARALLDQILSCDVERLHVGKAAYAILCYEDGGCVDDLILYRVDDEEYFLCVNAANIEKDLEWINGLAVGYDCRIDDVSDSFALLALQGPLAIGMFEEISGHALNGLRRFHAQRVDCMDTHILVSRTGYTGEDGLELYLPIGEASRIANRLFEGGKSAGLHLVGLGARDSLRLEAGLSLYGHEISGQIDLLTAGLGFAAKLETGRPFIGSQALLKKLADGLQKRVVYFVLEDRRIPRAGQSVCTESGTVCGEVLSGAQSPVLSKPIGSALIDTDCIQSSAPLYVDIRGKHIPIHLKRPPLHIQA